MAQTAIAVAFQLCRSCCSCKQSSSNKSFGSLYSHKQPKTTDDFVMNKRREKTRFFKVVRAEYIDHILCYPRITYAWVLQFAYAAKTCPWNDAKIVISIFYISPHIGVYN